MDEIKFHIEHYERNSTLKSVIIRSFDQQTFSKGTDFESLHFALKNGQTQQATDYLQKLFEFSDFMASSNVALIVSANGRLSNSAASIFTNLPFVYSSGNTVMCFNDIDRQTSLLAGVSYTLSRLPFSIGMYLGLTGNNIHGDELLQLGLVKDFADMDHINIEHIRQFSPRNYEFDDFANTYTPLFGHKLSKVADVDSSIREFFDRSKTENAKNVIFDLFYRKKIIEHANFQIKRDLQNPVQWLNADKEYYAGIENYLVKFEADVLMFLPEIQNSGGSTFDNEERDLITIAFSQNSLQDVYKSLESANSPFGNETLFLLKSKNQNVLEIIFRQIKAAENLTFGQTLKMEFATVLNLIETDKYNNFVFQKVSDDSNQLFDLQTSTHFADGVFSLGSNLKTSFSKVPLAFLPVKEFYNTFPESFRCYFNSQTLKRPELQPGFHDIIKATLLRYGIDYFNPTFDKSLSLTKLRQYLSWERKSEIKETRITELLSSPTAKDSYFRLRMEAIHQFLGDPDTPQRVETIIAKVFDDELKKQEQFLTEKTKSLGRLENTKLFNSLRKVIIDRMSGSLIISDKERSESIDMLLNLPSEIAFDRFQLTPKSAQLSQLNAIKNNYINELNLKTKNELKNYYKELLLPDTSILNLKQTGTQNIQWDKNRILVSPEEHDLNKSGGKQAHLAHKIVFGIDTKIETCFRAQFLEDIIQTLKNNSNEEISQETKNELLILFNKDIILNYKYANDYEKVMKLTDSEFLHFMRQLRPSLETLDLKKYNTEICEKTAKNSNPQNPIDTFNLSELEKLNMIDFKNQANQEFEMTPSQKSLLDLLYNNDVLQNNQINQIKVILDKPNIPFFVTLKNELSELYESKFFDLYKEQLVSFQHSSSDSKLNQAFVNLFTRESRNEFLHFITPHLFFNWSHFAISKFEKLFNSLANYISQIKSSGSKVEKQYTIIAKIVEDSGFPAKNQAQLLESVKLIDETLNFMLELNLEFKHKVNLKEDLIRVAISDLREIVRIKLQLLNQPIWFSKLFPDQVILDSQEVFDEEEVRATLTAEQEVELDEILQKANNSDQPDGFKSLPLFRLRRFLLEKFLGQQFNHDDEQEEEEAMPFNDEDFEDKVRHGEPERVLAKFNADEINILTKLKSYSETLREYLRHVKITEDTTLVPVFASENSSSTPMPFLNTQDIISRVLEGKANYPFDVREFIKENLGKNESVVTDFIAIQHAIESNFFTDLIEQVHKFQGSIKLGILGKTEGSRIFELQNIKGIIIKKQLTNRTQSVDSPHEYINQQFLESGIFTYVNKLESLSRSYFQNVKSGCFEDFYYNLSNENTRIPDHFNELDQRQSPQHWLDLELYKYVAVIFEAHKNSPTFFNVDHIADNVHLFFSQKLIANHFVKKLYQELFLIERIETNSINLESEREARMKIAFRTNPRDLDWKKNLENNEAAVKKFLAFESFAFHGSESSQVKQTKNIEYLAELSDEIYKNPSQKMEVIPESHKKEVEENGDSFHFVSERMYEEIVNSVSDEHHPVADSLKNDLSESLINVTRRLKLYK